MSELINAGIVLAIDSAIIAGIVIAYLRLIDRLDRIEEKENIRELLARTPPGDWPLTIRK